MSLYRAYTIIETCAFIGVFLCDRASTHKVKRGKVPLPPVADSKEPTYSEPDLHIYDESALLANASDITVTHSFTSTGTGKQDTTISTSYNSSYGVVQHTSTGECNEIPPEATRSNF